MYYGIDDVLYVDELMYWFVLFGCVMGKCVWMFDEFCVLLYVE